MPTRRRKIAPYRVDVLTDDQRMHLVSGYNFFATSEADEFPFWDEAHRRRAWALYRHAIMEEWFSEPLVGWAGRRPIAYWEYDCGLKLRGSTGAEIVWPRGIKGEAHMVCKLAAPRRPRSPRSRGAACCGATADQSGRSRASRRSR
jgi:hypothetical protein